ncbi:MAG TPA: prephenate dehydrogenase/arogenate dehydrogenase family protein [Actinophytocola sp.]|uniref:prephenate dehydrogenase n=1 Tax=Actinophytocola sp. TaxID=1872138 RepID=UPI002DBEACF1|nr:prephenate dehydrogenase/arogenate dehydrogenase family protein [Actinophytocola sp.]HEU5473531.1 prephenate dehydrogenase/arogenate dehydrogenase family protein [Actinophytocola sp.]
MAERDRLATVAVVGVGLIGRSIAFALRAQGIRVLLSDSNRRAVDDAVRRGAGERLADTTSPADLSVIAVPPGAVPSTLRHAQSRRMAPVYTDVSGVKVAPVRAARALGCDLTAFVPGHPIAEETAPAHAARPDLFRGRGWVLCPQEDTRSDAVTLVRRLIELCGAIPVLMEADTHDRIAALISHVPYLVASALAGSLADAPPEVLWLGSAAGPDVTGPAAGDPAVGAEILSQNATWVSNVLSDIAANLVDVCAALQLAGAGDDSFLGDVAALLHRGHTGRRRLAGAERPHDEDGSEE